MDQTTDGRYIQVGKGEWWDTTGTEIVPEAAVDQYIRLNPNVGIVVLENTEENDPRRES
jgi:hypothetical protein